MSDPLGSKTVEREQQVGPLRLRNRLSRVKRDHVFDQRSSVTGHD
jgi:hypothetical protein